MISKYSFYTYRTLLLLVSFLVIGVSYFITEEKIAQKLNSQLNLNEVYYQETYNHYKVLSNVIYHYVLDDAEVLSLFAQASDANTTVQNAIRQKIFKRLAPSYIKLKSLGFRQLHFHDYNNRSFLRMHKPEKFGDDLTGIRYTIAFVNRAKKPIDGFEEGRVVNGFRFVFPVFGKTGKHIGSLETSVSSDAFIEHIEQTYHSDVHFIIQKAVVNEKLWPEEVKNHYVNSLEASNYYTETKSMKNHFQSHKKSMDFSNLRSEFEQKLKSGKKFVSYSTQQKYIISFIPVKNAEHNESVAYFVIYNKSDYINEVKTHFYLSVAVILAFSWLLWYLIGVEHHTRGRIEKINQNLEKRIKKEVEKGNKRERVLMENSRLAQMGEMISMIAHQWRQPLGAIASTALDMKLQIELENYDITNSEEMKKCQSEFLEGLHDIGSFVENLTTTIDDFRNFYKPNKTYELLDLCVPVDKSLEIIRHSLESHGINIVRKGESITPVKQLKSELMQVFLNIIKNAQDNFIETRTENPTIVLDCKEEDGRSMIEITDNGGGIPKEVLPKIFDPYFSTKKEKNGTGLGLYMSKLIIEDHHKGTISVMNTKDGCVFTVTIPQGA